MDSSKANQQRRGSLTPSSMARTLWSSDRSPTKEDLLQSNGDDHHGVNVQVVLRCRPLNLDEINAKTPEVISCDELKREVRVAQNMAHKQTDRVFVFDKVFGPSCQQKELYDGVVRPVLNEVLEGYSWTIFAYGQTGTGKTYTMEGEGRKQKNGQFQKDAGVIPRVVQQIFDTLERERSHYTMKVTFLELYNEEITDLLAPDELNSLLDDNPKRPLALMEDGKGSVFVRGLEEKLVYSADEIYTILDKGSAKKHTAETLLNKQSNRSHSIFSISIQIKEPNSEGSEVIKCGKFNLVDLAGSENVLKSGAREVRAREAGEINKSLLTLGRVINALAENSVHVPYRESKLTRLLRDSLGGKTKTCIIATISPSAHSLEETLSTLDYASRAKSIKNRPEVNQKVVKSELVKDLYIQIYHLKQDIPELHATREKNGGHDHQRHEEATKKKMMELQEHYIYEQKLVADLKDELESTQKELMKTRESLFTLENRYQREKDLNKEKEDTISNLLSSGKELTQRAIELRSDLELAASDVSTLFARIEHKNDSEDKNRNHIKDFHSQLAQQLEELNKSVSASVTKQEQNLKAVQDYTQSHLSSKTLAMDELMKKIENLRDLYGSRIKNLDASAEELFQNSQLALSGFSSELSAHSSCIMDLVMKSSFEANVISNGLQNDLDNLGSRMAAFIQQQEENHGRTYEMSKSISQNLVNFFKTFGIYISKLTLMEEDSQAMTNHKLNAFTKKFEEFTLSEDTLLIEKMSELLADSRVRKKHLIQAAADDILESACKRTNNLNQELSNMRKSTAEAEENWTTYIAKTESNHAENSAKTEAGKLSLGDGLLCCITKSNEAAEQRRSAEQSLQSMLKKNLDSVNSFIKNGIEDNEKIYTRFSSAASSAVEETDDAVKDIVVSVEHPSRLDHEAFENIKRLSTCCLEDSKQVSTIHSRKVDEISKVARKSLLDDYRVDDSSSSSPRKRDLTFSRIEYFENLFNVEDSQESHLHNAAANSII